MDAFEVREIPEVLEFLPEVRNRLITREEVETIMEHSPQAILPISGDCLEGAQVMDGGWACIDFTRRPAPPRYKSKGGDGSFDLCLCWAVFPGREHPAVMCKQYDGVWGSWQMVSTHYDLSKGKHRMNCGFPAQEIFGVVTASWSPSGQLLWKRDPESFPKELGIAPTIQGGNIGDPIPLTDRDAERLTMHMKKSEHKMPDAAERRKLLDALGNPNFASIIRILLLADDQALKDICNFALHRV